MDVLPRDERVRRWNNKEKATETVSRTEKQTRQVRKGENDHDDGQKRGDKCGQTEITSWAIKRQKKRNIFFVELSRKKRGISCKKFSQIPDTTEALHLDGIIRKEKLGRYDNTGDTYYKRQITLFFFWSTQKNKKKGCQSNYMAKINYVLFFLLILSHRKNIPPVKSR